MRKVGSFFAVFGMLALFGLAGCSSDVGEECDEDGATGPCTSDAVCGRRAIGSSELICLQQCTTTSECSDGKECQSLESTSLRACRDR